MNGNQLLFHTATALAWRVQKNEITSSYWHNGTIWSNKSILLSQNGLFVSAAWKEDWFLYRIFLRVQQNEGICTEANNCDASLSICARLSRIIHNTVQIDVPENDALSLDGMVQSKDSSKSRFICPIHHKKAPHPSFRMWRFVFSGVHRCSQNRLHCRERDANPYPLSFFSSLTICRSSPSK